MKLSGGRKPINIERTNSAKAVVNTIKLDSQKEANCARKRQSTSKAITQVVSSLTLLVRKGRRYSK